jgi:uncharacterized delta-60 repeat protein
MKKIILCTIALLGLFYAYSQDGALDPSFAGKGWTTTDFTRSNFYSEYGRQVLLQTNGTFIVVFEINSNTILARYLTKNNTLDASYGTDGYSVPVNLQNGRAALQSDGKVVVTGLYTNANNAVDFGLARFNADGSPDNSFGVNGFLTTDFFGNYDWPFAIAIQTNGTIIVAGQAFNPNSASYDFGLAAYTTNGSLDASFGTGGLQTTDFFGDQDEGAAIAIQSDGKIVVAGMVYNSGGTYYDFGLARYNTDGSPDADFGIDGKQTTDFFNFADYAFAIAIQSDAKIVVAGQAGDYLTNNDDFALARYNTDGTLDVSFDGDGKQTTGFFSGGYDRAFALAIQTDGKIIAGGQVGNNATYDIDFGLARYTTDGALDAGFGTGGKQTTDFFGGQDVASTIAIQSDGKIIALGEAYNNTTRNSDFALARYNTSGSLDNRFDRDGKLTDYYAAGVGEFAAIAVQNDGKIIAAGYAYNSSNNIDFVLARFNADGMLDKTFNRTGRQTIDFSGNDDYVQAIAIQSDGKIVVAGSSRKPDPSDPESYLADFALARINSNGSLDNKFNRSGKQTTDFFGSIDEAHSIAIQSDGKIVVAGGTENTNETHFDFALARYNTNGSLDGTFGTAGKQTTDFTGNDDNAYAMAIQNDGKIIAAGITFDNTTSNDFALARYNTNGSLDGDFDSDGRQVIDFFGTEDYSRAIAIQNDKIVMAGTFYNVNNNTTDFALARLNKIDGSLDASFGDNGKQTTDFFEGYDYAYAMALQSDNKIVIVGGVNNPANGAFDFGLSRYTADGVLDVSFDGDGKQITDFSLGYDYAYATAIRGNELYVAGSTRWPVERSVLAAYSLGTTAPVSPAITSVTAKEQEVTPVLTVKAMPNPFTSSFTLLLQSANKTQATISITNAAGQVIEKKTNIAANSILQLGANYKPGIYYIEIVQGTEKAVVKMLKQ